MVNVITRDIVVGGLERTVPATVAEQLVLSGAAVYAETVVEAAEAAPVRLGDYAKTLVGLAPQTLNNTNATGAYTPYGSRRKIRAWMVGGAMAATKTTTVELVQATDGDGTDVKAVVGASAIITANARVARATVALAAVGAGDIVTVNGVSFTKAAATDASSREFADAAGLEACVENATYGVPGVQASVATTTVTLYADPAGDTTLTVSATNVGGTVTVATVEAQAYVELDVAHLDLANSFTHVAAKVTTTANTVVSVTLDLYDGDEYPTQAVAASAVL